MKKCLLLICLVMSACSVFSQLNKGQWLAGGDASFSYSKIDANFGTRNNVQMSTVQLSPGAGYFFVDKLVAGARVSYTKTNYHETDGYNYYQVVSLSPFIRYYLLPKTEKVNLFTDIGYLYGRIQHHFPASFGGGPNGYTITYKSHGYSIAAGPAFFLNSKTALELTVSFTKDGLQDVYQENSSIAIRGGVGFQIHL